MCAFTPAYVLGNHGIEGLPGYESRTAALAELTTRWRAALDTPVLRAAGVIVEDKRYSLSLHYRHAPDHSQRRRAHRRVPRHAVAGAADHPRQVRGERARARHADQGRRAACVARDARRIATALYAGDDDTDEHVFELPREQVLGVRVGPRDVTGATLFVDTPADMLPLVEALLADWPDAQPHG